MAKSPKGGGIIGSIVKHGLEHKLNIDKGSLSNCERLDKALDLASVRDLEAKLNSQFKDFSQNIDNNIDNVAKNISEKGSKILTHRNDNLKTAAIVAGIVTTITMLITIAIGATLAKRCLGLEQLQK